MEHIARFTSPNRQAGLDRLEAFLPFAGECYTQTRNQDLGPEQRSNVSQLSPYLRHRLLSEPEVIARVLEVHGLSAQRFIDEVMWRTYWKGWLEHRPALWDHYLVRVRELCAEMDQGADWTDTYQRAVSGTTDIEPFNVWCRELIESGYLHNHARMWFAHVWLFVFRLPWQLGADFFLRHLLDGDPASNTLSWRWVAGLHTKGKAYGVDQGNVMANSPGRFTTPQALAGLEGLISDPEPLVESAEEAALVEAQAINFPASEAPRGNVAWVVCEDDVRVPTHVKPVGLAALRSDWRLPLPVAQPCKDFREAVLAGGLAAAEARFPQATSTGKALDIEELVRWCKQNQFDTVCLPWAPTGFVKPLTGMLGGAFCRSDIKVQVVVDPYDQATWPYAHKGFFQFKKKMAPQLHALAESFRAGEESSAQDNASCRVGTQLREAMAG